MCYSPQDVYARHLVSQRGYPLWTPEPNLSLPDVYVEEGLRIGDVGVVVPQNGSFDVLFNICLPPTHPLHRDAGVPDNFSPILLSGRDIAKFPEAETVGGIICAPPIERKNALGSSVQAVAGPLNYEFTLSSREGGILILPEGAEHHFLQNDRPFMNMALEHAVGWYNFAEQSLGRIISHDSLYLITGFHKTRSWSLAAYQQGVSVGAISAQFRAVQVGCGNIPASYTWETTHTMDCRVGPSDHYLGRGFANQTVFIQGFKIAVREGLLGRKRIKVEADFPSVRIHRAKFFSDSGLFDFLGGSKSNSGSTASAQAPQGTGSLRMEITDSEGHLLAEESDSESSEEVTIERFPRVTKPFHPSDVINQYLLREVPSAVVAITHDNQWAALLDKKLLDLEELSLEDHLLAAVQKNYSITLADEDAVYLRAITSEFAPPKSVPRKRSLTNAPPVPTPTGTAIHHHSQPHSCSSSQSQPEILYPIITATASSPPLVPSSTSSPSSRPFHFRSLFHSHSSLSHSQHTHSQSEIGTDPASSYDDSDNAETGFTSIGDDVLDDDLASSSGPFSPGGSFANANAKTSSSSGQQGPNVAGKSVGTNNFVTKLYHMINDSRSQKLVTWTELGSSFVVSNVGEFSRSILGTHFKHNNFSSFVRQLNMYGFHKINRTPRAQRIFTTSQTWEFSHPKFLRDRVDLLEAIKRKALEPDPRERGRVEFPGEVTRLLSELREENRTLWQEIKSLSSRVPPSSNHAPATMLQSGSTQGSQTHVLPNVQVGLGCGHALTHSRSSSNLGGDDADVDWEDEDGMSGSQEERGIQSPGFTFGTGSGSSAPNFTFNAAGSPGDEWRHWAEREIIEERKRVEKLVGIVKALVDVAGQSGVSNMNVDREHYPIPPSIIQELHELSLTFDNSFPISVAIPSLSLPPSPYPWTCHPRSPNIYITSPTSPTPYGSSPHSRSPSRDSNPHTNLPTLAIPDSVSASSSHSFYSPLSSPTTSDIVPNFVSQKLGHATRSHFCPRMPRQPGIMFTPDLDKDGHVEKRARTDGDKAQDRLEVLRMGEDVPSELAEDVKLSSALSLVEGTSVTMNPDLSVGGKTGLRSRSDSAPMWGADGSSVQGGLSANWTSRGRSGSSFGQ